MIEKPPPSQVREMIDWLAGRLILGETPAMVAALEAGVLPPANEPTVAAGDGRKKIRAWTTGQHSL
jgi:hypothetical protein